MIGHRGLTGCYRCDWPTYCPRIKKGTWAEQIRLTALFQAYGSLQAGINVSVFEHEASAQLYRPREWTMALHWGLPLLESLLPDRMRPELAKEAYVDPALDWGQSPCNLMRMYNGVTGEIIKDFPVDGKLVRVSRRKLRTFLAQEIDIEV